MCRKPIYLHPGLGTSLKGGQGPRGARAPGEPGRIWNHGSEPICDHGPEPICFMVHMCQSMGQRPHGFRRMRAQVQAQGCQIFGNTTKNTSCRNRHVILDTSVCCVFLLWGCALSLPQKNDRADQSM